MTKTDPEELRANRSDALREVCNEANDATAVATQAVHRRDRLIETWQGPKAEGKFTYNELVPITGLSRARLGQIILGIRRKKVKP